TLESIYHDAGHPDEASRYGELASKYEERASAAPEGMREASTAPLVSESSSHGVAGIPEMVVSLESAANPNVAETTAIPAAIQAPSIPPSTAAPAKAAASGLFFHAPAAQASSPSNAPEFEVQSVAVPEADIDLSSEWEGSLAEDAVSASTSEVAASQPSHSPEYVADNSQAITETIDEIRFYLGQSMNEEAFAAFDKFAQLKPEESLLNAIQAEVGSAKAHLEVAQPAAVEEISATQLAPVELSIPETLEPQIGHETQPSIEVAAPAEMLPSNVPVGAGKLDDFVQDLESSLGEEFLPPADQKVSPEVAAATDLQPQVAEPQPWPQATPQIEAAA